MKTEDLIEILQRHPGKRVLQYTAYSLVEPLFSFVLATKAYRLSDGSWQDSVLAPPPPEAGNEEEVLIL